MRFLIEHSDTQREIKGSFTMCGTRADFNSLVRQLQDHLRSGEWSYARLAIREAPASRVPLTTKPWDE